MSGTAPLVRDLLSGNAAVVLELIERRQRERHLGALCLSTWSRATASTLQCWSLFITPEVCADGGGQCPGADLSLTMTASPITTPTGGPVTYTLSVSNAGPSPASNAVVNQTLPSGIVYQGAVSSQGTVSQVGSCLTFSLGTVGIQSSATITVTTVAAAPGLLTSTAGGRLSRSGPQS